MRDFQEILEQIAQEHGTTAEEVRSQMQLALDAAFENPSKEAKVIQDMMPFDQRQPSPEEFVQKIATLFQDETPFYTASQPPPHQ